MSRKRDRMGEKRMGRREEKTTKRVEGRMEREGERETEYVYIGARWLHLCARERAQRCARLRSCVLY